MGTWATGQYALRISDRSGMAFPYREMVQEWNGFWVHTSEFEPKQPQLLTYYHQADAVSLRYPKPQKKSGIIVELDPQYWPGQYLSQLNADGTFGMEPGQTPHAMNLERELKAKIGKVTVSTT